MADIESIKVKIITMSLGWAQILILSFIVSLFMEARAVSRNPGAGTQHTQTEI